MNKVAINKADSYQFESIFTITLHSVISMPRKVLDSIYVGSGQFVGGIVEGFKSLDDTVTKENIKYAIDHPRETASTAWNTLSDSFMNDFWHGDAKREVRGG